MNYRSPLPASLWRASLVAVLLISLTGCEAFPEITGGDTQGKDDDGTKPGEGKDTITVEDIASGGAVGGEDSEIEAVCGNGKLEPGEICDDGGTKDDDGCSADCLTQDPEFDCSVPGEPCVDTVVCGNDVIEGDEACDDGDESGGDGCSADCKTVEDGYVCPRPGVDCLLLPVCGNGTRERGEQCDDGDDSDPADGCHGCEQADGFFCIPGTACIPEFCGNGVRTPNEECDDGPGDLASPVAGASDDGCSAACEVEDGWLCPGEGACRENCGDGQMVGSENSTGTPSLGCDDGNRVSGDGCSAACTVEPGHLCDNSGTTSACGKDDTLCGNASLDVGEICDPALQSGCLSDCSGYTAVGSVCGNDDVEPGELCDDATDGGCCMPGDLRPGCSRDCMPHEDYTCPPSGTCFLTPYCGDGTVDADEDCDDGNGVANDGCTNCAIDPNYECAGFTNSVCVEVLCPNGEVTADEQCDDDNTVGDDGCTDCVVDSGYVCPVVLGVRQPCREICGDDQVVGDEECDDGNANPGDGCNAACRVEDGYACEVTATTGGPCTQSVCGNAAATTDPATAIAQAESGEGCDDGNTVGGDGCSATCQNEPRVGRDPSDPGNGTANYPDPQVPVVCGDGVVMGAEECDDGNTTDGDGCDSDLDSPADDCVVDPRFTCSTEAVYPSAIEIQVTYRDFLAAASNNGHPDFQRGSASLDGMVGPVCTTDNNTPCNVLPGVDCPSDTCGMLDADGKPVLHLDDAFADRGNVTSAESFGLWYRDYDDPYADDVDLHYDSNWGTVTLLASESSNTAEPVHMRTVQSTLTLTQDAAIQDRYTYTSAYHFPLTGYWDTDDASVAFRETWNDRYDEEPGRPQNFHFTTELRYFFQYTGGEVLEFTGDDDVWVFVNGRLAVDLGGVHGAQSDDVTLGNDGDGDATTDSRFGLVVGDVYEIVLFHAERQSRSSNFNLTLQGFIAPRSVCEPICGDEEVVGWEVCDDGDANADPGTAIEDMDPGQCNATCTIQAYCGDDYQQPGELCDNGDENTYTYMVSYDSSLCSPSCQLPAYCGDATAQASQGEQCDNGSNTSASYVQNLGATDCAPGCLLPSYCGDGTTDGLDGETCDQGANNGVYAASQAESCDTDCRQGPYCGDGTRNGPEQCDDGPTGSSFCTSTCELIPQCGDGLLQVGEDCDYGTANNTGGYGGCTSECKFGPTCGDGSTFESVEECDAGPDGPYGEYGGCLESCVWGPRCGDGDVQSAEGEACDNGWNNDTYQYSGDACGAGCLALPYCGDGTLQASFELCDNGSDNVDAEPSDPAAYDACTSSCVFGPYCGDGTLQSDHEDCDDGLDNTAYSEDGQACGYDCKVAAYCGDGVRNGPEQCDLGTDENTGEHNGCEADCTLAPYCGDSFVQDGEQCDDGPTGSLTCSSNCTRRSTVK